MAASRAAGTVSKVSASTSRRPGAGEAVRLPAGESRRVRRVPRGHAAHSVCPPHHHQLRQSNRPQIVDPLGRNLTPKPLAAPPGTTVAAKARAGGGAGGTLAQSGVSVASDGDLGGDTQSAGGFTHSVASDAESTGAAADGMRGARERCVLPAGSLRLARSPSAPSAVADADESAGDGGADAGASDAPTTIENTARANQGELSACPCSSSLRS